MASNHCFLLLLVSLLLSSSLVLVKSDDGVVIDQAPSAGGDVCYWYNTKPCKTVADCVDVCAAKRAGAPSRCVGDPMTSLWFCCCYPPPGN